jgi:hypothetical protein
MGLYLIDENGNNIPARVVKDELQNGSELFYVEVVSSSLLDKLKKTWRRVFFWSHSNKWKTGPKAADATCFRTSGEALDAIFDCNRGIEQDREFREGVKVITTTIVYGDHESLP